MLANIFRKQRKKAKAQAAPVSRSNLGDKLRAIFSSESIGEEQLKEFERLMLLSDVGVEVTTEILNELKLSQVSGQDPMQLLQESIKSRLQHMHAPLVIDRGNKPHVILVIGVNGSGKTTSIGKLCNHLQQQGEQVMIAAGDTFRAAAVEQLQVWGERNNVPVIAQGHKADSASVIFDGVQAARARNASVLIADTAGRMHTRGVLMDELKKIIRVIGKIDSRAPHEILLVVDGRSGQNVRRQVEEFRSEFRLSGLFVSKLDNNAKGGIVLSLSRFKVPVRFLGTGEDETDLMSFDPQDYAERVLGMQ